MQITIAETLEYINKAKRLLNSTEQQEIIDYLSQYPKAGVLIQGTGGIRKLRWSKQNKGKRGGVRVIYYYHDEQLPLYLLTLFGKNDKEDLSMSEKVELGKLAKLLLDNWFGE